MIIKYNAFLHLFSVMKLLMSMHTRLDETFNVNTLNLEKVSITDLE